jgi:GH35 family endo-1,4-beta-xylanase
MRLVSAVFAFPDPRPPSEWEMTVNDKRKELLLLGCNAYGLGQCADPAAEQAYRDRFSALLNYATLPFYWGRYEPLPGQTDQQHVLELAHWCQEQGIRTKGHPLCWHEVPTAWLADRSLAEIGDALWNRIQREVSAFRGLIGIWDVVNEAVVMPTVDPAKHPVARLCADLGQVELIKRAFQCARSANPAATLLLNDYDTTDKFATLIDRCLQAGVSIDVIGIQSHMHQGYWGAAKTEQVLDRFSRFKLPLHFTELTILSGRLKAPDDKDWHAVRNDWPNTSEGEALQLQQASEFYSMLLADPNVKAITWWDFSDLAAWQGAPAGLLRKDMSPKPLYPWLMERLAGNRRVFKGNCG